MDGMAPVNLENAEFKFPGSSFKFESIYIFNTKTKTFTEEKNQIKSFILKDSRKKASGTIEISPTEFLNKGMFNSTNQVLPFKNCPDHQAKFVYDIQFMRLAQLDEDQVREELSRNRDLSTVTDLNYSQLSSLHLQTSNYNNNYSNQDNILGQFAGGNNMNSNSIHDNFGSRRINNQNMSSYNDNVGHQVQDLRSKSPLQKEIEFQKDILFKKDLNMIEGVMPRRNRGNSAQRTRNAITLSGNKSQDRRLNMSPNPQNNIKINFKKDINKVPSMTKLGQAPKMIQKIESNISNSYRNQSHRSDQKNQQPNPNSYSMYNHESNDYSKTNNDSNSRSQIQNNVSGNQRLNYVNQDHQSESMRVLQGYENSKLTGGGYPTEENRSNNRPGLGSAKTIPNSQGIQYQKIEVSGYPTSQNREKVLYSNSKDNNNPIVFQRKNSGGGNLSGQKSNNNFSSVRVLQLKSNKMEPLEEVLTPKNDNFHFQNNNQSSYRQNPDQSEIKSHKRIFDTIEPQDNQILNNNGQVLHKPSSYSNVNYLIFQLLILLANKPTLDYRRPKKQK